MAARQENVPVQLADSVRMYVEATMLGGEQDIAFKVPSFDDVTSTIEHIAGALTAAMKRVKPKKASVEFGLEIAVESGKPTTLLVQGSGKANLTISLEWGE